MERGRWPASALFLFQKNNRLALTHFLIFFNNLLFLAVDDSTGCIDTAWLRADFCFAFLASLLLACIISFMRPHSVTILHADSTHLSKFIAASFAPLTLLLHKVYVVG